MSAPDTACTGLLGGTFNPVHLGHLALAREARKAFGLDEVWLIPCAVPPHKTTTDLAPDADRLAMLRLATAGDPALRVSDIEMHLPPPSWTLRTLDALRAAHPGRRFAFIIGGDTLTQLHTWHEPLQVLERARFVTLARAGYPKPGWGEHSVRDAKGKDGSLGELAPPCGGKPPPDAIRLPPPWPGRLLADYREAALPDVSSSGVRERIRRGEPIDGLVPDAVIRDIGEKGLYR